MLLTNWMTGRRIFSVEIHSPGISVFGEPVGLSTEGGSGYSRRKGSDKEQESQLFRYFSATKAPQILTNGMYRLLL